MGPRSKLPLPSTLLEDVWRLPDVGEIRMIVAFSGGLEEVDNLWPSKRRDVDVHDWSWRKIAQRAPERYAIQHSSGQILAIWCSGADRLMQLPGGFAYRLD